MANERKDLEKALKGKIRELVRELDDQLLITLPAQKESWEYDRKGYAGGIPEVERVDGVIREKLERFYDLEELKEVFTRRELDSWIYSIAEEEAQRRGLTEDRLYEINVWTSPKTGATWHVGFADLGESGDAEVRKILYNPKKGKAYLYADLYLEPSALKEQGWLILSKEELERLSETYYHFVARKVSLEEYLGALKPYLPEDFDFEAVKLEETSRVQEALYPVVYEIDDSDDLGEVVAEGREVEEFIERGRETEEEEDNSPEL